MRNQAILNLYSSAVTVVNGGESVLDKDMNPITIDETKVAEEAKRLQAEYDAQEYARNRKADYPDTGTQFNKIYDDGVDKWKTEMVDPVKTKWPKDNSGPVE